MFGGVPMAVLDNWLGVSTGLSNDRRLLKLAKLLQLPVTHAAGIYVYLAFWWQSNSPDGFIADTTLDEISDGIWQQNSGFPKPTGMGDALLASGFVVGEPDNRWRLADWDKLFKFLIDNREKRAADAERKRAERERRRLERENKRDDTDQ